jgi:molybdate/tungstate transport system permease protein
MNGRIVFALLGFLVLFFISFPLLNMLMSTEPSLLYKTFTDREVMDSIGLTLYASLLATSIALLGGIPLAYLLARVDFPGKSFVEGVIDVPIVIPHSAAGIALLMVFGREFFLGRAFDSIGIRFTGSVAGIVIAMLFVSVPFLIDAAREGFESVDPRLEKVARTLGATHWQTFWRISLPLAWRGILAGAIMMWARGISEFGAVLILTYHPMVAPILIYERFETYGLRYARPAAVLLILVCLLIFAALRALSRK